MGILGPSRKPREPDPQLDIKILLFLAGAGLAILGMATRTSLLVWLAFVPLLVAIIVRVVGNRARIRRRDSRNDVDPS